MIAGGDEDEGFADSSSECAGFSSSGAEAVEQREVGGRRGRGRPAKLRLPPAPARPRGRPPLTATTGGELVEHAGGGFGFYARPIGEGFSEKPTWGHKKLGS